VPDCGLDRESWERRPWIVSEPSVGPDAHLLVEAARNWLVDERARVASLLRPDAIELVD
jgi:hypothetical protein